MGSVPLDPCAQRCIACAGELLDQHALAAVFAERDTVEGRDEDAGRRYSLRPGVRDQSGAIVMLSMESFTLSGARLSGSLIDPKPYHLSDFGLPLCDAIPDGPYCIECANAAGERLRAEMRDASGNRVSARPVHGEDTRGVVGFVRDSFNARGELLASAPHTEPAHDLTPHHTWPTRCPRCGEDFATSGTMKVPGVPGLRHCRACWADVWERPPFGETPAQRRVREVERIGAYKLRLKLSELRDRQEALQAALAAQPGITIPPQWRQFAECDFCRTYMEAVHALAQKHPARQAPRLIDVAEQLYQGAATYERQRKQHQDATGHARLTPREILRLIPLPPT